MDKSVLDYATPPFDFVLDKYRSGYNIVVIGENHCSQERHKFVSHLVALVKREHDKLKLGLELNVKWQKRMNQYISSNDASSTHYFETGRRKGTNYSIIIDVAAELQIPVLCLDRGGEDRDEGMASRVCEGIDNDDIALIYVGALHASNDLCDVGGKLKNIYGRDKVFTVYQEVEDEVRTSGSFTDGFTAEIDKSDQKSKSMAFDLRNAGLRRILAQMDEGRYMFGEPLYDHYDGFIYLAKNLKDLSETSQGLKPHTSSRG